MIISMLSTGSSGGQIPMFTYTGASETKIDSGGWQIRFLSSGTLSLNTGVSVDVFLVGGGGNGSDYRRSQGDGNYNSLYIRTFTGGGGGSGHTNTQKNVALVASKQYEVIVGGPNEDSSITPLDSSEWEENILIAERGDDGGTTRGGAGGSGGASGGYYAHYYNGAYMEGQKIVKGGQDGSDGENSSRYDAEDYYYGGRGQRTTTREFGDANGELYASGGGSYFDASEAPLPVPNTGNGGAGGVGGLGSSGIVIIRNARA